MPFIPNKLICDTALSKVGKLEYKFGGGNIEGGVGDCSDFTQWVYSCYNVDIGGIPQGIAPFAWNRETLLGVKGMAKRIYKTANRPLLRIILCAPDRFD